jgi:hypothetical protein
VLVILMLAQLVAASAQGGEFPWKPGDAPPPVAGIRLGDPQERLTAVLGQPNHTQSLGEEVWAFTYLRRGVEVLLSRSDGASIIYLRNRAAGDIGGVRLGDHRREVLARWGDPSTGSGDTALYVAGGWVVVLKYDRKNRIKQLGLGRVAESSEGTYYRKDD